MKRLFIVVEGQTEEEFVNELLSPYLNSFGIYDIRATKITTSKGYKGGFVNYEHLRNDVIRLLKQSGQDVVVTTFVDFFKMPKNVPDYANISKKFTKKNSVGEFEKAIAKDINDQRFVPYIQMHEFEALLFSSTKGFSTYYGNEKNVIKGVTKIIEEFSNPEDINSTQPPSYRIKELTTNYDKIVYGNTIALDIGIESILKKCPRFKIWVKELIVRCK
ncbi:MAG: DUF4276 family protein [Arcicella sp.]|nr:DUF4276 family protein [Arcicella sp.]